MIRVKWFVSGVAWKELVVFQTLGVKLPCGFGRVALVLWRVHGGPVF